jgi:hypothetical protein
MPIDEMLEDLLFKGAQKNVGRALAADVIDDALPVLDKISSLIRIADRVDAKDPVGAIIHVIDLLSPPILEQLWLANTFTTILEGKRL